MPGRSQKTSISLAAVSIRARSEPVPKTAALWIFAAGPSPIIR